jgi:hypothetical protein
MRHLGPAGLYTILHKIGILSLYKALSIVLLKLDI